MGYGLLSLPRVCVAHMLSSGEGDGFWDERQRERERERASL